MAVSADFAKILDKSYEDKGLDEILAASPAALAGVTDNDAPLLQEAFGIKTHPSRRRAASAPQWCPTRYSKAWKNVGKVPMTPSPIRTREMIRARLLSYAL